MINPAKANPEKSEEMAPKLSPKTPAFETEYSLIGQDKYSKVPAKSKYIDSIPPKTKNAILPTYKYPNLNALILRPARIFLERARHTTRFTRCGRDHYVGSRPRPRAQRLPPRAAREVHFCARRQVPSADLVTQVGSRDCKVDTGVTKPRVNPTLYAMQIMKILHLKPILILSLIINSTLTAIRIDEVLIDAEHPILN